MKKYGDKQEISIMTLLANEATSDARKLLKKYGKEDAKDYNDLELKLTQLYFGSPDKKLEIEKDMASIHPHKKWLTRNIEAPKVEEKKEEVKVEEVKKDESTASHCNCPACERARVMSEMKFSNAEGDKIIPQVATQKDNSGLIIVGALAITAMFTLSLLHINKNK